MKRVFAAVIVIVVIIVAWWFFSGKKQGEKQPKQEALKIQKHSADFNSSIDKTITSYLAMKDAFVNADTTSIRSQTQAFIGSLNAIKLNDLSKDDSSITISAQQFVSDVKVNAEAVLQEKDVTEMRQDFRMVSENLYPFLRTISYEGTKLYWQNCPMAFGDNNGANWISNTRQIINPYLGKNHPQYKATMLGCGENKDSLQ